MAKKLRPRAQRRALTRETEKLARDAARLHAVGPGGSAARPLEVQSASEIEPHAARVRCPVCDGELSIAAHEAVTVAGARLRLVRAECRGCRRPWELWFRIGPVLS
jgi:uncharacterized protein with PIN domain